MNEQTLEIVNTAPQQAAAEFCVPYEKTYPLFEPFRIPYKIAEELLAQVPLAKKTDEARSLRLKLVKARTSIERAKKDAKSDIVFAGRVIDYYNSKGVSRCQAAESELEEIEKAAERAEAARKAELKAEREIQLRKFEVSTEFFDLANMPEEGYQQLLESSRVTHAAKIEAARKVEEERAAREKAEAEAREAARIQAEKDRAENERLKAEAVAREEAARKEREAAEKALAKERAKAAAEAAKIAEAARKEREAIEAKAKAEAEAARKQAEEERKKREAIENEIAAKAKAEADAARRAEMAPDKEKIEAMKKRLALIDFPKMQTKSGQKAIEKIFNAYLSVLKTIENELENL